MAGDSEFFALYRRPEWQRKRLEVMEAADFQCQDCEASDRTLNVHHRFYKKGAKPWEYEAGELICLCEQCHSARHNAVDKVKRVMMDMPAFLLESVAGYALGRWLQDNEARRFGGHYADFEGLWEVSEGIVAAFDHHIRMQPAGDGHVEPRSICLVMKLLESGGEVSKQVIIDLINTAGREALTDAQADSARASQ